jgi:hypothetical protein
MRCKGPGTIASLALTMKQAQRSGCLLPNRNCFPPMTALLTPPPLSLQSRLKIRRVSPAPGFALSPKIENFARLPLHFLPPFFESLIKGSELRKYFGEHPPPPFP